MRSARKAASENFAVGDKQASLIAVQRKKIMGQFLTRAISVTAFAAALSLPAGAATSTSQIDPNQSAAQFAVRPPAISTGRGAVTKMSGTVQVDRKDISKSSVE